MSPSPNPAQHRADLADALIVERRKSLDGPTLRVLSADARDHADARDALSVHRLQEIAARFLDRDIRGGSISADAEDREKRAAERIRLHGRPGCLMCGDPLDVVELAHNGGLCDGCRSECSDKVRRTETATLAALGRNPLPRKEVA